MALERLAATGTLLFGSAVVLIHAIAGPERSTCESTPNFSEEAFICTKDKQYAAHFSDGSIATFVTFEPTNNSAIIGLVMFRTADGTMYVAQWDATKNHNRPVTLEKVPGSGPDQSIDDQPY